MQPHIFSTALPVILLGYSLAGHGVAAQALDSNNDTIIGCLELDCPIAPGISIDAACTVIDQTFQVIGLARIPTVASFLQGFSWVQGFGLFQPTIDDGTIDKSFYLGVPSGASLAGSSIGACAVIFSTVSDAVTFDNPDQPEVETLTQGTCSQAMSPECVAALTTRAEAVLSANKRLSSNQTCAKLVSEFENNMDEACIEFSNSANWTGLVALPLAGPGAPQPINSVQNSSTNCWPITPKSDSLTLVKSFQVQGNIVDLNQAQAQANVTPILTVFYPGNGTAVTQAESQLTCLKGIDVNSASNATMSSGDGGSSGGGGGSSSGGDGGSSGGGDGSSSSGGGTSDTSGLGNDNSIANVLAVPRAVGALAVMVSVAMGMFALF